MSLKQLSHAIRNKLISCEHIVIAFCLRCCSIGVQYGYVTEIFLDEAVEEARAKDKIIEQNDDKANQELPMLFGIPYSVKDQVKVKDSIHFLGMASRLNSAKADSDSAVVGMLRKEGAIVIA